jgi:DNA repair exonuclease SbcCD nuclease subunit
MALRPSAQHFCFVHAADLHLDTPFSGVHESAPSVALALRDASLEAFDAIVALALERDAAFVVVAGDVYDGAERGLRAQLRFRDGLERLGQAGIASFVVHGNHDPVTTGWSAIDRWPDSVTVFGHEHVGLVPVERAGEQVATVQGISHATRAVSENLALGFARPDAPGIHVGVLHCAVRGAADGYATYSPCTLGDLRRTGLDYWALGHVHQHRVLAEGAGPGDPWVVYAGNSQARSPRASERGAKGAVVVHVDQGRVERVEHVACDSVRFVELSCPIDGVDSIEDLEDLLVALGDDALERADGRAIVVRARLVGHAELHSDLTRPGAKAELVAHLRDGARRDAPFCWWDDLVDESRAPLDLGAVRARGDFSSDLLALAESVATDADALEALGSELVDSVPRSLAGDLGALVRDQDALRRLLDAATRHALDELSGGAR